MDSQSNNFNLKAALPDSNDIFHNQNMGNKEIQNLAGLLLKKWLINSGNAHINTYTPNKKNTMNDTTKSVLGAAVGLAMLFGTVWVIGKAWKKSQS